jgi:FtsX-like permease family
VVLGSCGLATGVFLAAVVFGASLSSVLARPGTYGWPWDVGILAGYGYGQLDSWDRLRTRLDARDDIASWTGLGLTNDVSVDGQPVLAVVALDQRAGVDFSVVDGRPPRTENEVALGTRTADERGVGVGDRVELRGNGIEPHPVTVTGLAVLPPLGQFGADRAAPGEGMVLPAATFGGGADALMTFVGIDLAPGADGADVLAGLRDDFTASSDVPPLEYHGPVRPAEIINVRSMRAAPLLVGGLLAGSAVVGLAVAVVVSVRARRRDLAILRALGLTGRQVRSSVRVQALATMAAALAVGVPLGIAVGRVAWRAFAVRLGVVTDPSTPVWWIVVTVAGSLAVALAAATIPARLASRINPATALRTE